MDRKNNNPQAIHPNNEAVMAEYRAGVAKLQNILTSSQAQVDFHNKTATSLEQATARMQAKFASGQLETLSALPKNINLPALADSHLSTQQTVMQTITDSWLKNPFVSSIQQEALQAREEALKNLHHTGIEQDVTQTLAEVCSNPHWGYAAKEVRNLSPEPSVQDQVTDSHEKDSTGFPDKYFENFRLAEKKRELKENIVISGIAINIKKDRIKNKIELNIDYNKSYPPTKNSPGIYNEKEIQIYKKIQTLDTEIINGLVSLAEESLSDNRGTINAGKAFKALLEGSKNSLDKIEHTNDDIDTERAIDLYNQNYLELKSDIIRSFTQSISSSMYKESYTNPCLVNPLEDPYKICPIVPENHQ